MTGWKICASIIAWGQARNGLQLDQGLGPVAEHTMELEEAQLGILRPEANLVLELISALSGWPAARYS
jgi:hypothetical protein